MIPKKIGRFDIVRELAKAAHGATYKAADPRTSKAVAIRTIAATSPDFPKLQAALRQAQTLESPNIVRVQAVGDFEGGCYVVTEFVEGRTVRMLMSAEAEISIWDITDIARQVCRAIDHAHSRRLAHGNLTPANIVVECDGNVKVLDYGLLTDPGESVQAGRNPDALHYLSPEQARGEEPTRRSNLFSLGVILYEMIARSKPWGGEVALMLDRILHAEPAPLQTFRPALDPRIGNVVLKAMAKSLDDRYQSGAELICDLENSQKSAAIPPAAPVAAPQKPAVSIPSRVPPLNAPVEGAPPAVHRVAAGAQAEALVCSPTVRKPQITNNSQAEAARQPVIPVEKGAEKNRGNCVETRKASDVPQAGSSTCAGAAQVGTGRGVPACTGVAAVEEESPREFLIVGSHNISPDQATTAGPPKSRIPLPKVRIPSAKQLRPMLYAAAGLVLLAGGFLISSFVPHSRSSEPQPQASLTVASAPASSAVTQPDAAEASSATPVTFARTASERARKRKPNTPLAPAPVITGQLLINSNPPGAVVQLDGQSSSELATPYTATGLNAGRHTVVVSKPGYATESRTVEIAGGQQATLVVSLRELGATVSISSDPAGAAVFVDGNDIGRATPVSVSIPKGTHTVVVRRSGFLQATATMDLAPGQIANFSPTLVAMGNAEEIKPASKIGRILGRGTPSNVGKLQIRTSPKGAQVTVNERVLSKTTPAEFTAPAGTYEVMLVLAGHKPVRRTVTVNAGSTSIIDEPLQ